MSEESLADFPQKFVGGDGTGANEVWDFHKYIPHHDNTNSNDYGSPTDYVYQLGDPVNIEEFAEQAQIVAYAQYRALFEGYTSRMWATYTGVLLWKSQGPWPHLRGDQYDWYLQQKGSFWGAKAALQPRHVQLNLPLLTCEGASCDSWSLSIVNLDKTELTNALVKVTIYDLTGVEVCEHTSSPLNVAADVVQELPEKIFWPTDYVDDGGGGGSGDSGGDGGGDGGGGGAVLIIRLQLLVGAEVLDQNTYWQSRPSVEQNYAGLSNIRKNPGLQASLEVTAHTDPEGVIKVNIQLASGGIGFFVRLVLVDEGDAVVAPVHFSDNMVTLIGNGDSTQIDVDPRDLPATTADTLRLRVSGWNTNDQFVVIESTPPTRRTGSHSDPQTRKQYPNTGHSNDVVLATCSVGVPPPGGNGDLSDRAIVGITAGAVAFLVLSIGGAFTIYKQELEGEADLGNAEDEIERERLIAMTGNGLRPGSFDTVEF
jgi:hypothetical protein